MEEEEKFVMWLIGGLVDNLPNCPMPTNGQLRKVIPTCELLILIATELQCFNKLFNFASILNKMYLNYPGLSLNIKGKLIVTPSSSYSKFTLTNK
jgi:hypothetical protein